MSAFSDPTFDFKGYLANRPRYPQLIYDTVLEFHKGERDVVLDAGAGPGLSLFPFARYFKHLIATDVSKGMIDQASQAWQAWNTMQKGQELELIDEPQFLVASSEQLTGIKDSSIDLITAATAAHWFDIPQVWPELARVLRPGGTVAFWTYGDFYLPDHAASTTSKMNNFMSESPHYIGPYWPQPARDILRSLLLDIPFPHEIKGNDASAWDTASAKRIHHKLASPRTPDVSWALGNAPEETFRLQQIMTFKALNDYLRTSSALLRYFQEHPEKAKRPDMVDDLIEEIRQTVLSERRSGNSPSDKNLDDDHVAIAWPLGLMMIRKKK